MNAHLERALVLMEQSRLDLAERELRQALAADPDNGYAHTQLAWCLCARKEYAQATDEARTAIRLEPDSPHAFYVLGRIYLERGHYPEAEEAANEALRLFPYEAEYFALLADVRLAQKQWDLALEAAERGLESDAEHVGCNNARAIALTQLGRRDEAGATLASTLARDPENPFSHCSTGWNELHKGNVNKALEHFREALRLAPDLDFAREGMVEALKARYFIYGLMLKYFLWMGRLSAGAQWGIILGAYLGYRVLGELAQQRPDWAPFIWPLLILYVVFAIMTWISGPLFNLLLRLNRFGRHALSTDQKLGANCIGVLIVLALGALIASIIADDGLLLLALYFGLLLMPVAAIFNCQPGWPRNCMIVYTLALMALGPAFYVFWHTDRAMARLIIQVFAWGAFLSGIVGNLLMAAHVRR
jgi:tetratricopeptide (TPR) repeat protein